MKKRLIEGFMTTAGLAITLGLSMNSVADQVQETVIDGSVVPTWTVSFKRSDLATAEGRAAVERRIQRAAGVVCGSTDHRTVGSLHAVARNEACYERAVEDAVAQLTTDSLASID